MNTGRRKRLLLLSLLAMVSLGATTPQTWELVDRFKNVSVGEWVKLKYSGGSEHLLLVAAKDDKCITLEEKVREEGYLTSWTQIVIDLKKKKPVLVRERMPTGETREIRIEGEDSGLNEDFHALLNARFWEEPGTEMVVVPAGRFRCKVYGAVYNKKFIRIFFSDRIPLYPVQVFIPSYNLTIRLMDFGKGMESRFSPGESGPQKEGPEEATPQAK